MRGKPRLRRIGVYDGGCQDCGYTRATGKHFGAEIGSPPGDSAKSDLSTATLRVLDSESWIMTIPARLYDRRCPAGFARAPRSCPRPARGSPAGCWSAAECDDDRVRETTCRVSLGRRSKGSLVWGELCRFYFAGSFTSTTRSPATSCMVSTIPEGQ